MYSELLRPEVSQGDIFRVMPFLQVDAVGDVITTSLSHHPAILLTYDCEYDKPRVDYVLVARIRPFTALSSGSQGNVRAGRVASAFHLAAQIPMFEESYVDFYHIVPVRKTEVARLSVAGERLASLDDTSRQALQRHIALYFGQDR